MGKEEKADVLVINYTIEVLQKRFSLHDGETITIKTPKTKLGKVLVTTQNIKHRVKDLPNDLSVGDSFLDDNGSRCVVVSINKKKKTITLDFERMLTFNGEYKIDYRLTETEKIRRAK